MALDPGEDTEKARVRLQKRLKAIVRTEVEEAIAEVIQAEDDHLERSIAKLEQESAARRAGGHA